MKDWGDWRALVRGAATIAGLLVFYAALDHIGLLGPLAALGRWFGG